MADVPVAAPVESTLENVMDAIMSKPVEKPEVKAKAPSKDEEPPRTPTPKKDDEEGDEDDDLLEDPEAEEEGEEDEEIDSKDPDSQLIEVTVDGEAQKVTLKDLKQNYSGNKAIAARIQQATETKIKVEKEFETLSEANKGAHDRLSQLDAVLAQFSEQKIDWDKLKAEDPLQYALKREEIRDVEDKRKLVQAEMDKVRKQQQILEHNAFQKYLGEQAELLMAKLPAMGNPKKAAATMNEFVQAGSDYYGYTEQELRKVSDHRVFIVLNDAVKYRKLLARRKEAQSGQPDLKSEKKTLRVGSSTRPFTVSKKREEAIVNKAKESGKPDDVAATLLVRTQRRP